MDRIEAEQAWRMRKAARARAFALAADSLLANRRFWLAALALNGAFWAAAIYGG